MANDRYIADLKGTRRSTFKVGSSYSAPTLDIEVAPKKYVDDSLKSLAIKTIGPTGSGANYECDGVADDVQFNAAITAMSAGDTLRVLAGTYNCVATINVTKKLTLEGVSRSLCVIQAGYTGTGGSGNFNLITIGAAYCVVHELELVASTGQTGSYSMIEVASSSSFIDIYDCVIVGNIGVQLRDNTTNCRIQNNYFNLPASPQGHTIALNIPSGTYNTQSTLFNNNLVQNMHRALYQSDSTTTIDQLSFTDNTCWTSMTSILVEGWSANMEIRGNVIQCQNGSPTVQLNMNSATNYITDASITDNTFDIIGGGSLPTGVDLRGVKNCVVANNNFGSGLSSNCVTLRDNASGLGCIGNIVIGNTSVETTTAGWTELAGSSDYNIFSANRGGIVTLIGSHSINRDIVRSDTTPSALGSATPGTSLEVSRRDHVHTMPSASDVGAASSGDLTNHVNATGTNVHGLGTLSTHALGDVHTSNGFVNLTDSVLQINGSNFEVAVANGKSNFVIYSNGTPITKTTAQQIALSSFTTDNTIYYIYFDSNGTIQKSESPWAIVSSAIPAAIIHKSGSVYRINDERHLAGRNLNWHQWAHELLGCRWETGGALTYPTVAIPNQLSVSGVIIHDEDIENPNQSAQTTCWIMYRTASGTSMKFNSSPSATPYVVSGSNLQYDDGSGTLASAANNSQYVCYWLYATMSTVATGTNLVLVVGQSLHNTLASAQAASLPTIPLSTAEWKLLYRFIYKNTGATPTFIQADDYRNVVSGPASAGGSAQVSASNVLTNTTNFTNGVLRSTDTTVQAALERIDAVGIPVFNLAWTHGLGSTLADYFLKPVARVGASFALAMADSAANIETVGVIVGYVDANTLTIQQSGKVSAPAHGYTGPVVFVSPSVAGGLTETAPSTAGQFVKPIFKVTGNSTLEVVDYPATEIAAAGTYSTTFTSADARISAGVITITHGLNQKPLFLAMMDGSANPVDVSGLPVYTSVNAFTVDLTNFGTLSGTWTLIASKGAGASVAAGFTNPMTTAGDIITATTGGTPARLAMGSGLQVLRVNSGATALEYATPSAGGMWTLVERWEPTSAATYDFAGLDGNTARRYMLTGRVVLDANPGGTGARVITAGGVDSGSNYQIRVAHFGNTYSYSLESVTYLPLLSVPAANKPQFFTAIIDAKSGVYRFVDSRWTRTDTSYNIDATGLYANLWKNATDNITGFRMMANGSGNFVTGTCIELWKLAQ